MRGGMVRLRRIAFHVWLTGGDHLHCLVIHLVACRHGGDRHANRWQYTYRIRTARKFTLLLFSLDRVDSRIT